MRPADAGERFIQGLDAKVSFKVVRPQSAEQCRHPQKRFTFLDKFSRSQGTPDQPKANVVEDLEDGRTRVVWDIDPDQLSNMFGSPLPLGSEIIDGVVDIERGVSASWSPRRHGSSGDTPIAGNIDTVGELEVRACTAYMDGESVEYFSGTHQRWISGTIAVQSCPSMASGKEAQLSVLVNHGAQLHENVPLHLLRPMLQPGEMVEVYANRDGGAFLPATLALDQPRAATLVGYRVKVDGVEQPLENIPAERLRRRFPAASSIEVFRGPSQGWSSACVHYEAASADGCGAEVLPLPKDLELLVDVGAAAQAPHLDESHRKDSVPTSTSKVLDGQNTHHRVNAADIGLWTNVPLSTPDGTPEWISSHLLRSAK